jgi:hypothetical protein
VLVIGYGGICSKNPVSALSGGFAEVSLQIIFTEKGKIIIE